MHALVKRPLLPALVLCVVAGTALLAAMGPTDQLFDIQPSADASSTLVEKGKAASFYAPERALDGRYATAWCVGKKGSPAGEWIRLQYRAPLRLDGVSWKLSVFNGYGRTRRLYYANNRIKDYELQIEYAKDGRTVRRSLQGRFADNGCASPKQFAEFCELAHGAEGVYPLFDYEVGGKDIKSCIRHYAGACIIPPTAPADGARVPGQEIELPKLGDIRSIRLQVRSVYPGRRYKDTCVTDMFLLRALSP